MRMREIANVYVVTYRRSIGPSNSRRRTGQVLPSGPWRRGSLPAPVPVFTTTSSNRPIYDNFTPAVAANNPNEEYLVLGGVSVFEAQAHWFTQQLDNLAQTIHPPDPHGVEFHASEIFGRRNHPWRGMGRDEAQGVIKAVLTILRNSYDSARVFACAVHKASYPDRDPMELAFEDLCSRFDMYLNRLRGAGDRQRGLIILDESAHMTTLQRMAREFRTLGTRWGAIRNLADTPLFIDSRASRLVQVADHVAYAVFRRYNAHDANYMDIMSTKFDTVDGVLHGLSHKQRHDPRVVRDGVGVVRLTSGGRSCVLPVDGVAKRRSRLVRRERRNSGRGDGDALSGARVRSPQRVRRRVALDRFAWCTTGSGHRDVLGRASARKQTREAAPLIGSSV